MILLKILILFMIFMIYINSKNMKNPKWQAYYNQYYNMRVQYYENNGWNEVEKYWNKKFDRWSYKRYTQDEILNKIDNDK